MRVKLKEKLDTSIGPREIGEVDLPKEEALSLIRDNKASLASPPGRFLAGGRGVLDRMLKTILTR